MMMVIKNKVCFNESLEVILKLYKSKIFKWWKKFIYIGTNTVRALMHVFQINTGFCQCYRPYSKTALIKLYSVWFRPHVWKFKPTPCPQLVNHSGQTPSFLQKHLISIRSAAIFQNVLCPSKHAWYQCNHIALVCCKCHWNTKKHSIFKKQHFDKQTLWKTSQKHDRKYFILLFW